MTAYIDAGAIQIEADISAHVRIACAARRVDLVRGRYQNNNHELMASARIRGAQSATGNLTLAFDCVV